MTKTFTISADYQSPTNEFPPIIVHDLLSKDRSQVILAIQGGDDIVSLSKLQFETLAQQMGYVKK